jgi:hypothetical protein
LHIRRGVTGRSAGREGLDCVKGEGKLSDQISAINCPE